MQKPNLPNRNKYTKINQTKQQTNNNHRNRKWASDS